MIFKFNQLESSGIQHPKKVLLSKSEYTSMMKYAEKHPHTEIIGIFFGTLLHQENDAILIEESYNFREGGETEVDFIEEDYIRAVPLIKKNEKKGLKWLGWFHSHPFQGGDHLYMSRKDIDHHQVAQSQNPYWTAIVLNPYQKDDPNTTKGAKAFCLKRKLLRRGISRRVERLDLEIVKNDKS